MKPGKFIRHLTVVAIVASAATASAIAVAVVIEPKSAIEAETARVKAESDRIIYLLSMREFDKALELATKLIETDPKDPNGYNLRGAAYAGKKDLPNARKDFEEAIKLQPNTTLASINVGDGFVTRDGAYWSEAAAAGQTPVLTIDLITALGTSKISLV